MFGQYEHLKREMRLEDDGAFRDFVRVELEMEMRLENRIAKQDTWFQNALEPYLK